MTDSSDDAPIPASSISSGDRGRGRPSIRRIKEQVAGALVSTWRVVRTSNAYDFPPIAKTTAIRTTGQNGGGTEGQAVAKVFAPAAPIETDRSLRWKSLRAELV